MKAEDLARYLLYDCVPAFTFDELFGTVVFLLSCWSFS